MIEIKGVKRWETKSHKFTVLCCLIFYLFLIQFILRMNCSPSPSLFLPKFVHFLPRKKLLVLKFWTSSHFQTLKLINWTSGLVAATNPFSLLESTNHVIKRKGTPERKIQLQKMAKFGSDNDDFSIPELENIYDEDASTSNAVLPVPKHSNLLRGGFAVSVVSIMTGVALHLAEYGLRSDPKGKFCCYLINCWDILHLHRCFNFFELYFLFLCHDHYGIMG